jgi:chromosome segregation ATPase
MATKRAAKRQGGATEASAPGTSPHPVPARADDAVPLPLAGIEAHLTALRSDGQAMQRQLETIGSALRTAILSDVFALIAQTDAPELTEVQRRAQAIQVELTLRRQEIALAEWRRKLEAATQEGERQRQLFARLEADFAHRSAQSEQVAGELARVSADFAHRSAEFERTLEAAHVTEATLRTALADQAKAFVVMQEEREAAFRTASMERESALAERASAQGVFEAQRAEMAGKLDASIALAEARGAALHSCEQDSAALAREISGSRDENAALQDELAALRATLDDREKVLTEAERRIEELRSSRWRRLGVGLGVARRATFE